MLNKIILLLLDLFDPHIKIPQDLKKRVEQEHEQSVETMATISYVGITVGYISLFYLLDQNKTNLNLWAMFRFGIASSTTALGLIALLFKRRNVVLVFNLYIISLLIQFAVSWSMSFTLGNIVQPKWIVMIPALILMSVSKGLIIPLLWVFLGLILSKPLWFKYTNIKPLVTDSIFTILMMVFVFFAKRIWVQSKINKFLHDDAVQESIQKQIEFDNEIKRFISPVLVQRIEEKTNTGQTLVMALDDVLMRKESPVAVMFTDMRNFSTRSVDTEFVEKELVPSSSKIIDSSEDNMGIAKQIGDAVFVYYAMEDPEEGLLRATKDAVAGCIDEKQRIKELGRQVPERFFSLAYGPALVGNMASFRHREATVIGSPANLAARMDSLTKEASFSTLINDCNKVLLSKTAKELLQTFHDSFEFNEVNLEDMNLIMKSFPNEKNIYLFPITTNNLERLNSVLEANNIKIVEAEA